MKTQSLLTAASILALSALQFAGCASSAPMADISSSATPSEEVTKFEQNIVRGRNDQIDVLAPKDFKASEKWLREAKDDTASNESGEEILKDVRKGQGHLDRARATAERRHAAVQPVLKARQAAIAAGAREYANLNSKLNSIDEELTDESDDLGALKAESIAKLQARYMDLEIASVQAKQLGRARATVAWARNEDADDIAPQSLKQAEVDLKTAENVISAKGGNPQSYMGEVIKANTSAALLKSVVETIKTNKGLKETAAIEMVRQKNQIAELNDDIERQKTEETKLNAQLSAKDAALTAKSAELTDSERTVKMQTTIDNARREFNSDEAEVFQQGNKLVVRLKALQFSTGKADLPQHSLEVLSKVKNVADELKPEQIVVEGHTDSTGSATVNKNLSLKRAQTVATYFSGNGYSEEKVEAVGRGFEKPISSNKSKEGRAQNRRVDVIITPSGSSEDTRSI